MAGKFSSHDPQVISVFEVVGAYFCDTIFNHIYHSAKVNAAEDSSLADEFTKRIQAYVVGIKNDTQCYQDIAHGVHKFFTNTTRFTTLRFAEFVDRVVSICVPEDYQHQLSAQDKDEILCSVLCDLVSNLAAFSTQPDMLRRVIDGHATEPNVTVRMLQDSAVTTLITKRDAMQNKFLRKLGQACDSVSLDVVEDMKVVLRRLVLEKAELLARAEKSERALKLLDRQVHNQATRERKLTKLVELLQQGRTEGPASAGLGLRIPRRDRIAEGSDPFASLSNSGKVPRSDRIAESAVATNRRTPRRDRIAESTEEIAGPTPRRDRIAESAKPQQQITPRRERITEVEDSDFEESELESEDELIAFGVER